MDIVDIHRVIGKEPSDPIFVKLNDDHDQSHDSHSVDNVHDRMLLGQIDVLRAHIFADQS